MRKASLVLSIIPFAVSIVLLVMGFSSYGYEGLGYLLVLMLSMPVLMISSIIAVVLAFRKTTNLMYDQAAKVMSIISVAVFGSAGVLSLTIFLITAGSYNNLGSDVTYHG